VEHNEYHDMVRRLTAMMVQQHEWNGQQAQLNARLTLAIERIDRTLAGLELTQARIETLLARMLPQSDNGREA
jgi:phenylalanyl-tRNA synthetase beta subunit